MRTIRSIIILLLMSSLSGGARKGKKSRRSHRDFKPYDVANLLDQTWLRNLGESESRRQGRIPTNVPFPCSNERSARVPTSVDRVRPADIDVIAAMGDSLVAGNGALEDFALGTFIESRGVSWAVGGDETWHEFLTLPNILKTMNPNVQGYSVGKQMFLTPTTALNAAFPVSADQDAIFQAKTLVHKMKTSKTIDFQNHWKLVTMFFGANDICSGHCYNKEDYGPSAHAVKLMRALDYLQNNMPRTIVNLIPVLDVSISVRVKRSFVCRMMHRLFCACFHRPGDVMTSMIKTVKEYQNYEQALISSGRYDRKSDFTVVIQPFMTFFNAPRNSSDLNKEAIDASYTTYDCFHFSQKAHALVANLLWNNLLEPIGQKSREKLDYPFQKIYCPTEANPFIFTENNTLRFYQTGSQL